MTESSPKKVAVLWSDYGAEEELHSTKKILETQIKRFATVVDPLNRLATTPQEWGRPILPKIEESDVVLFIYSPDLARNDVEQDLESNDQSESPALQFLNTAIQCGRRIVFLLYKTTEFQLRTRVSLGYYDPPTTLNQETVHLIARAVKKLVSCPNGKLSLPFQAQSRYELYREALRQSQPCYQRCLHDSRCSAIFTDMCLMYIGTLKRVLSDACIRAYSDGKTTFFYDDHKEAIKLFKSELKFVKLYEFLREDEGRLQRSNMDADCLELFKRVDGIDDSTPIRKYLAVVEDVWKLLSEIRNLEFDKKTYSSISADDQLSRTLLQESNRDCSATVDVLLMKLRQALLPAFGEEKPAEVSLEDLIGRATDETNCLSLNLTPFLRLCMLRNVVFNMRERQHQEENLRKAVSVSGSVWWGKFTMLFRYCDIGELFLCLQDVRSR